MEKERELEGNQLGRQSWWFRPWKELCLSSEGLQQFCCQALVFLMLARGLKVSEGRFQRGGADARMGAERK